MVKLGFTGKFSVSLNLHLLQNKLVQRTECSQEFRFTNLEKKNISVTKCCKRKHWEYWVNIENIRTNRHCSYWKKKYFLYPYVYLDFEVILEVAEIQFGKAIHCERHVRKLKFSLLTFYQQMNTEMLSIETKIHLFLAHMRSSTNIYWMVEWELQCCGG